MRTYALLPPAHASMLCQRGGVCMCMTTHACALHSRSPLAASAGAQRLLCDAAHGAAAAAWVRPHRNACSTALFMARWQSESRMTGTSGKRAHGEELLWHLTWGSALHLSGLRFGPVDIVQVRWTWTYAVSRTAVTQRPCMQLVKMKGRVACEISTCECLIATEAIFRGLFTDLPPAEAAALLCTLVNQNKTPTQFGREDVPASLVQALRQLEALTTELGAAQGDVGLKVDPEDYRMMSVRPSLMKVCRPTAAPLPSLALVRLHAESVEQVQAQPSRPGRERRMCCVASHTVIPWQRRRRMHGVQAWLARHLPAPQAGRRVQVTHRWALGEPFVRICDYMPEGVMEGDVVRTVTRLEHACQDMCSAARVMGNTTLYDQFEEASRLIKRDIIFAASLYIA